MADFSAIRGLAFDLDGTLVDSAPGLAAAIDMALMELGCSPAGEARVGTWIGNGADVLVQRALRWAERDANPELGQQMRARFDHFYAQTVSSGSRLFPQVRSTLAQLAAAGYPMALVTNKPTPFVAPLLQTLGIFDYFSLIIGGDDVIEKKPHPAPLYLVLGKLGLHASQLLFVGDSRNDIQAAQAAGCPSVGLTYGYNYGEAIALSHPDRVLERFADLLPALGLSSLENQEM
ncbi:MULTISPECIES: phosphoglycolate phosphatase [Gammaproteobacteria]|uniref:phosphoglycolate phosphatase n=1 Tax=Gammaproteobacteria TaxID=1236 RepID=UPI002166355D|nr:MULTISPECIES: phosphoglycolate phosphatase [Gammaproteobacteria]MCS3406242.1 phosphoglycolate phosphatase [Serratia sp. AKBS12]MDH4429552.1 phosphoglycolate phosphatase [Pseudomonas shirazica]HEI8868515.1 phosphoglycolate phosphatase [Serratia odorifera]